LPPSSTSPHYLPTLHSFPTRRSSDLDKIDFINKEMYNVVLSIDGRKEVNDYMRFHVDGTGCYDQILPKFQKLVKARGDGQYYVRDRKSTRLNPVTFRSRMPSSA